MNSILSFVSLHHRDTEDTEGCFFLCDLCVSVVSF